MNFSVRRADPRRGSALITAVVFAVMASLLVGSYLQLSMSAHKLANRSFYANAAMNLAENGVEQAMWSLQAQLDEKPTPWAGWTSQGGDAKRSFPSGDLGNGITGLVRVHVEHASGTPAPIITARSTITPSSGPAVDKYVRVQLRVRSLFANGLTAKETITFNGQNYMDSWISDLNADGDFDPLTGASAPYSPSVKRDKGSASSISVVVGSVMVNNADIWGYVNTGLADPTGNVKNNGSILGEDSASKDKSTWTKSNVDPDRVSTDFTYNFKDIVTPDTSGKTILSSLPASFTANTEYYVTSITKSVVIDKPGVKIIITAAAGQQAISLTGNDSFTILNGCDVQIYTEGDIKVAGKGLINNGRAAACQIYGTVHQDGVAPAIDQKIDINGNGVLSASVYAPYAQVSVNGGGSNGQVAGAIVGKSIVFNGSNAQFHYDESLAQLGGKSYGVLRWDELTDAGTRAEAVEKMNF